jgi:putative ABC transport system ATP-binding protein
VTRVLEAFGLSKVFDLGTHQVQAVRDVSLTVEQGEFVAIMGPSGSGKSTLLHLLSGVEAATAGRVLIEGVDITRLADNERSRLRRRRIGFVFQKINLLPTLSALENVALPLLLDGVRRQAALADAAQSLAEVDLEERLGHLPHELSGGEQQRVAIARAMVTGPAMVFADEPTGSLDSVNSERIIAMLCGLAAGGQTLVTVTHDAHVAARADRTLFFRDGCFSATP